MDSLNGYDEGLSPSHIPTWSNPRFGMRPCCSTTNEWMHTNNRKQLSCVAGQKDVDLTLNDDAYRLTFFEMTQAVRLNVSAPPGTKFVANGAKKYTILQPVKISINRPDTNAH